MISISDIIRSPAFRRVDRVSFSSELSPLMAILGTDGVLGGQTVEWVGAPYCGKTGVLLFWVAELCRKGMGVAWIDSHLTLDPQGFAFMHTERFWVVRPEREKDAAFFTEALIKSGCFGMIVLELTPRQPSRRVRRLQQLAKTHGVILLWVHEHVDARLEGVVAHRVRVVGTSKKVDSPLSEWCSPHVRVSLENLKRRTGGIDSPRTLNLTDTPRLNEGTWIEISDRRTSALNAKTVSSAQ